MIATYCWTGAAAVFTPAIIMVLFGAWLLCRDDDTW